MLEITSIFSLLLLTGCFVYLFGFILKQYNQFKEARKIAPRLAGGLFLRMLLAFVGLLWGILIGIFLIWFGFLRESYPLPTYLWITGLILTTPYIGGGIAIIWSMQYGVEFGLSTQKIRTLFPADKKRIHPKAGTNIEELAHFLPPRESHQERWKRKPEDEVLEIKKQFRRSSLDLTMPIGVSVISFLAIIFVFSRYQHPNAFKYTIMASFSSFIITLISQFINGRSFVGKPKPSICNLCHREEHLGLKKCNCGGIYEPSEFYYN